MLFRGIDVRREAPNNPDNWPRQSTVEQPPPIEPTTLTMVDEAVEVEASSERHVMLHPTSAGNVSDVTFQPHSRKNPFQWMMFGKTKRSTPKVAEDCSVRATIQAPQKRCACCTLFCDSKHEAVHKWGILAVMGLLLVFLGVGLVWEPLVILLMIVTLAAALVVVVHWTLLNDNNDHEEGDNAVTSITLPTSGTTLGAVNSNVH